MSRSILSIMSIIFFLFVLLIFSGCSGHRIYYEPDYTQRFYIPRQIPIEQGMFVKPEFSICKLVTIVNVQDNEDIIPIGSYTHKWWGNLRKWTETATGVLKTELKKRGVKVTKGAPKILKLSITQAELFWRFWTVECKLNLRVTTGDGYTVNFKKANKSTDLYDCCDGAVSKAVAAMFDDDNIRNYLTCPVVPKDSDCDTVPDDKDLCPGTPQGIEVDERGCPPDSDGDGVPDYLDKCPDTPKGVRVDSKGCPLDSDGDGVPDGPDKCPGTPKGVKVDSRGCPLDSDGDGVPDYLDKCPDTPKGVKVDSRGCPPDSDRDGVPDYLDKCPGTPRGVKVDSRGCPLDSDRDGVPDYIDQCPDTPEGARVDSRGCWVLGDTLFDFNKHNIKPKYYHVLNKVVAVIKRNPYLRIEVQGHTCNLGSAQYNQTLSENRARAVMYYLAQKGIEEERLTAVGYGKTRPKVSCRNEACRALNRRVELHVLTGYR